MVFRLKLKDMQADTSILFRVHAVRADLRQWEDDDDAQLEPVD